MTSFELVLTLTEVHSGSDVSATMQLPSSVMALYSTPTVYTVNPTQLGVSDLWWSIEVGVKTESICTNLFFGNSGVFVGLADYGGVGGGVGYRGFTVKEMVIDDDEWRQLMMHVSMDNVTIIILQLIHMVMV